MPRKYYELREVMFTVRERAKHPPVSQPEQIAELVRPLMEGATEERVVIVVMNARLAPVSVTVMAQGGGASCLFPLREIIRRTLEVDGRALAVAHNHPSGNPVPSIEDRMVTRELEAACKTVGIRYVDHLVITDEGFARVEV